MDYKNSIRSGKTIREEDARKAQGQDELSAREVLRKFVKYYKPFTVLFFADLFCAIIVAAVDLAWPQIFNFFIRDFFYNAADAILSVLPWVAAGLIALYLVRTVCQYFIACWGHIMGARMEARMRLDLFNQYQRLSFSYYDKNNTGEMMSKLVTDLFDISEVAHHGPENLFICALKIIGAFVLLLFTSIPLTLILLAATAVMTAYSIVLNYRRRHIFRRNRQTMAEINTQLQDSLGGIRVVKSFGNEDVETRKFDTANDRFIQTKELSYHFLGQFQAASSLFTGVLYTVTLVGGGWFIAQGQMQPADLILYALYIGIFIAPIEQLINFTETFQKGYAGFRRFVETLAEKPDVIEAPNARDLSDLLDADSAPRIEYKDVSFSYDGSTPVLENLSLTIPSGKTVALVGPSGGGKTTTCSLLPRFYDAQSGSICLDGIDTKSVTIESLRQQIGLVQQDVFLFEGSIRDNILYGNPAASEDDLSRATDQANLRDFIDELPDGLDTFVGERGTRLSGGQKQRIAIARVFLRNPRILILDEATSALDNESEGKVQAALDTLSADRTTVVIAHRLSTIRNADIIAVVDKGTIHEVGTHEELLARGGVYARYYELQFSERN